MTKSKMGKWSVDHDLYLANLSKSKATILILLFGDCDAFCKIGNKLGLAWERYLLELQTRFATTIIKRSCWVSSLVTESHYEINIKS